MNEVQWYVRKKVHVKYQISGLFTSMQIVEQIAHRRIKKHDEVSRDGYEWVCVSSLPLFRECRW